MRPFAGRVWRILPADGLPHVLKGAVHPEGRFHHDGQPAIYLSTSPENAGFAVAAYLRPGDPPRVIQPLRLEAERIADLRESATPRALGLRGHEAATPWMPERAAGRPATTWAASDAARAAGAQGMIYTARSAPERWHLVIFDWNSPGGARLAPDGAAESWTPDHGPHDRRNDVPPRCRSAAFPS